MVKMRLSRLVSFFLLQLMLQSQVRCVVMDMMPNAFDDQYIGCEAEMEKEAPKLLEEEKSYKDFRMMWDLAEMAWAKKKPVITNSLPTGFKDEYGTAVVLYTMQWPHAIHPELNKNVSVAGKSRDYYMSNFHFKALHFYLTRALQLLKPDCKYMYNTYRGSTVMFKVSDQVRFGQFASSSRSICKAEGFGTETFFTITTCFGADINELSDFEEQEILIPVYEKFKKVQQTKKLVTLKSTGKSCSYFNCAYFGGEKRATPLCCLVGRKETVPGSILSPSSKIPVKSMVQLQDSESSNAEICKSVDRKETVPGSILSPSFEIREISTVQLQDSESSNAEICKSVGRKETVPGSILSPSFEIREISTVQRQDSESIKAEIFSSAPGGNLSIPWIYMVFAGLVLLFWKTT